MSSVVRVNVLTPEHFAEARARSNVKLHAMRLHAFCGANWESRHFAYVEEEIREEIVAVCINLRRLIEIANLKGKLPLVKRQLRNSNGELFSNESLWEIAGVCAHIRRMKCSGNSPITHLNVASDSRSIVIEPLPFVEAVLDVLNTPQTEYPIEVPTNQES